MIWYKSERGEQKVKVGQEFWDALQKAAMQQAEDGELEMVGRAKYKFAAAELGESGVMPENSGKAPEDLAAFPKEGAKLDSCMFWLRILYDIEMTDGWEKIACVQI